jgi:hypothetical protein
LRVNLSYSVAATFEAPDKDGLLSFGLHGYGFGRHLRDGPDRASVSGIVLVAEIECLDELRRH